MRTLLLTAALTAALAPAPADAEGCAATAAVAIDGLGTPADELLRVGELAGAVPVSPRLFRRGGAHPEPVCDLSVSPVFGRLARLPSLADDGALRIWAVPPRLETAWNSTYPSGANDGLLWAGRGVSQLASGGAALRWGMLSAALAPEVTWSENRAFELRPTGRPGELRFANPWYGDTIDLPQRFGAGPFAAWRPGQSYVQVERWNVALGLSTENLWIGPGLRSAILLSNAGPGFPHVYLGTARPVDVWIGEVEARAFWGRLDRTRFVSNGGHPLIQGLVVDYSPRWVPGLSVGLGRLFVQPWDGLVFRDYFAVLQPFAKSSLTSRYGPLGDNPMDNQLASLFARWVFPESGLELWAEWAREDHEANFWGVLREPDHSQGVQLGIQKVHRAGGRLVRVHLELTHLQEVRPPDASRGMPVFYIHGNDLGLTNGGQLLGSWVGPGGDSQTLGVDVFHAGGRVGGYVERVRRNDAWYWANLSTLEGSPHDAELVIGARQVLDVGAFQLSWDAAWALRQNRDFLQDEMNVRLQLGIAWLLR